MFSKIDFRVVLPLFTLLTAVSCGFADLRPVGFSLEPSVSGSVLSGEYTPVVLGFDTEMERSSAEGILRISSHNGMVEGDISWKGNSLYFVPVSSWTAGTRYTLSLSGQARSLDGRELRLEKYVFFYAINSSASPAVKSFSPEDGASVAVLPDSGESSAPPVAIHFSCPMERSSTESAFSVDGFGEKKFRWSCDDTVLEILPEKNLSPWTVYRWTLDTGAKSRGGVPMAKALSAQFSTDRDRLIPEVEQVYPAIHSGGIWLAAGSSLETGLGPGQGIVIRFNKPVGDGALNSARFEPSLSGRTERLSENSLIFIPVRDPLPETVYTLTVSADAKDSGGLKTGGEYRVSFRADIPWLRVVSFGADGVPAVNDPGTGTDNAVAVPVDVPGGGALRFTLHFSLPFDARAKQDAALKISLSPFFPGTLPPAALRFVTWLSDDRLRMEWEGLKPGTSAEPVYYRLAIPGGSGGINTGNGMYLKEDQYLYLEAQ